MKLLVIPLLTWAIWISRFEAIYISNASSQTCDRL